MLLATSKPFDSVRVAEFTSTFFKNGCDVIRYRSLHSIWVSNKFCVYIYGVKKQGLAVAYETC